MDVTSHHLDVLPPGAGMYLHHEHEESSGDELTKRGERFGYPVGKGVFPVIHLAICAKLISLVWCR
jgi:hypothetical protein